VALPAGFAISPSAAGGREACTPAEIGLNDAKAPTCPEPSKVGTATIATPLLEDPLEGSLYLAQPYDNEAAFARPNTRADRCSRVPRRRRRRHADQARGNVQATRRPAG